MRKRLKHGVKVRRLIVDQLQKVLRQQSLEKFRIAKKNGSEVVVLIARQKMTNPIGGEFRPSGRPPTDILVAGQKGPANESGVFCNRCYTLPRERREREIPLVAFALEFKEESVSHDEQPRDGQRRYVSGMRVIY